MLVAILLAILCALATALLPTPAAAGPLPTRTVIYGIAEDNNIYSIDPQSGQVTGTTSTAMLALTGSDANAFALDRDRAQIYFLSTQKDLYYWDLPSGTGALLATATELGISGPMPNPRNATFINDNNLFCFIADNDFLLRSGSISFSGGLPQSIVMQPSVPITSGPGYLNPNDIAYDPDVKTIYGSNFGGEMFSLDVSSLGGSLSYTSLYTETIGLQLAYDKDYATLYGQDYNSGQWYSVATTVGGSFTPTGGTTPEGFRMRDLAGGVAVPEPGSLTLAACGVVACGGMLWRRRNRRRRSPGSGAVDGPATADGPPGA